MQRISAEVDREITGAVWHRLGIHDESGLEECLSHVGRPEDPPANLVIALSLALSVEGLEKVARQIAAAAARDYLSYAGALERAAERPRRKDDQALLERAGADWRSDKEVGRAILNAKGAAHALKAVAGGETLGLELSFSKPPARLRDEDFMERSRIRDAVAPMVHDALAAGDGRRAQEALAELHEHLGDASLADEARAASVDQLEIAGRCVAAFRELGSTPSPDPINGLARFGPQTVDALDINRLVGERAERLLAPHGEPLDWHQSPRAGDLRQFEGQVRAMLRAPQRWRKRTTGERHEGEALFIPVGGTRSMAEIASAYADSPAFAGWGFLYGIKGPGKDDKAPLSIGMRLAFRDADHGDEYREVWAVLRGQPTNAHTAAGRARACGAEALGLKPGQIETARWWDPYPRSGVRAKECPRMRPDEVLTTPERTCRHQAARWTRTEDRDALRLGCNDCGRQAIAVVPRHRLPAILPSTAVLPDRDEEDYLAAQRFHARLRGGEEKARSITEMRERDGIASLDPATYGAAPRGPELGEQRRAGMARALGRRR